MRRGGFTVLTAPANRRRSPTARGAASRRARESRAARRPRFPAPLFHLEVAPLNGRVPAGRIALAPEAQVQPGIAYSQAVEVEVGQPLGELRVHVQPVVWSIRPQAEQRLQEVEGGAGRPGLG